MDRERFLQIVDATPLVSIDMVIVNPRGEVLLGHRANRPAQGFWFVPGGRIRKNETLDAAFERISLTELGTALARRDATLLGAYDHLYPDNFHGTADINTHYVVLGYKVAVPGDFVVAPDDQHTDIQWWPVAKLLADDGVHPNTKAYFQ